MRSLFPALLLIAPLAQAQPAPALEALRRIMTERIQDRVGLTDSQTAKVVDRWQKFQQEHMARAHELAQIRRRFQDILVGPLPEDQKSARIKPLLAEFNALRRQQQEARQRFEDDICADLSPAQQARLIVAVEEITLQIGKALENRPMLRELRREAQEQAPRRKFR